MQTVCILVLCGIPGAGKTTFARKLAIKSIGQSTVGERKPGSTYVTRQEERKQTASVGDCKQSHVGSRSVCVIRFEHISYDNLIPPGLLRSIIETDDKPDWKDYRRGILSCTEWLIQKILGLPTDMTTVADVPQALLQSFMKASSPDDCRQPASYHPSSDVVVLIIDDNNYYKSMRYEYYQLARKYTTGYAQVYFQCTLEEALRNNNSRAETVPEHIISDMSQKFEPPAGRESWEMNTVMLEAGDQSSHVDRVLAMIKQASSKPVQPLAPEVDPEEQQASREACLNSLVHQADLLLRQWVSHTMTSLKATLDKSQLRTLGPQLNIIKTAILSEMKHQSQDLPAGLLSSVLRTGSENCKHTIPSDSATDRDRLLKFYVTEQFRTRLKQTLPKTSFQEIFVEGPS